MNFVLYVDLLLNPGEEPREAVRIAIRDGVIQHVEDHTIRRRGDIVISSSVCSPALFNAHDHLKYTWPERVGRDGFHNSYDWLPLLYREAGDRFLDKISIEDLYWLGTYKSIFAGVTTVANHCRPLPSTFFNQFPIRILHDFRREIFVRADRRAHKMGLGAAEEARLAKRDHLPFVVHIAEGTDAVTAGEVDILDHLGGLFERSVLVHAININQAQVRKIADSRASVVWCPSSNMYLFDATAPIGLLTDAGVNVALGTDSTCSGARDLIAEMRYASTVCVEVGNTERAGPFLHAACTVNGARAFGLTQLGRIAPGYRADILVFENSGGNPFMDLMTLSPGRIRLLLRDGLLLLRQVNVEVPSSWVIPSHSIVEVDQKEFEICGDPEAVLSRASEVSGRGREFFPLGKIISSTSETVLV